MAYARNTWNNDDPKTPLSAERLNRIEQGIDQPTSPLMLRPSLVKA